MAIFISDPIGTSSLHELFQRPQILFEYFQFPECNHYWLIAGVLFSSLLLWAIVKHSDARRRDSRLSGSNSIPGAQQESANSTESLDLALELAESFFQQGEREIANLYIEEVLEEGTEKQRGLARQLSESRDLSMA